MPSKYTMRYRDEDGDMCSVTRYMSAYVVPMCVHILHCESSFLAVCDSLSFTHPHLHTHIYTHTYTHSHAHTHTHTHTHSCHMYILYGIVIPSIERLCSM
jgi:hypothetical protein